MLSGHYELSGRGGFGGVKRRGGGALGDTGILGGVAALGGIRRIGVIAGRIGVIILIFITAYALVNGITAINTSRCNYLESSVLMTLGNNYLFDFSTASTSQLAEMLILITFKNISDITSLLSDSGRSSLERHQAPRRLSSDAW